MVTFLICLIFAAFIMTVYALFHAANKRINYKDMDDDDGCHLEKFDEEGKKNE